MPVTQTHSSARGCCLTLFNFTFTERNISSLPLTCEEHSTSGAARDMCKKTKLALDSLGLVLTFTVLFFFFIQSFLKTRNSLVKGIPSPVPVSSTLNVQCVSRSGQLWRQQQSLWPLGPVPPASRTRSAAAYPQATTTTRVPHVLHHKWKIKHQRSP